MQLAFHDTNDDIILANGTSMISRGQQQQQRMGATGGSSREYNPGEWPKANGHVQAFVKLALFIILICMLFTYF
jgi:hypothetical protein